MYIWRYLYWFNEFKAFGISGLLSCVLYLTGINMGCVWKCNLCFWNEWFLLCFSTVSCMSCSSEMCIKYWWWLHYDLTWVHKRWIPSDMKVNTYSHSSEDAYEEVRIIYLIQFFMYMNLIIFPPAALSNPLLLLLFKLLYFVHIIRGEFQWMWCIVCWIFYNIMPDMYCLMFFIVSLNRFFGNPLTLPSPWAKLSGHCCIVRLNKSSRSHNWLEMLHRKRLKAMFPMKVYIPAHILDGAE